MTAAEIKALRARLDLTQEAMARVVGVSWTTVNRWETGRSAPRGLSVAALRDLVRRQPE